MEAHFLTLVRGRLSHSPSLDLGPSIVRCSSWVFFQSKNNLARSGHPSPIGIHCDPFSAHLHVARLLGRRCENRASPEYQGATQNLERMLQNRDHSHWWAFLVVVFLLLFRVESPDMSQAGISKACRSHSSNRYRTYGPIQPIHALWRHGPSEREAAILARAVISLLKTIPVLQKSMGLLSGVDS